MTGGYEPPPAPDEEQPAGPEWHDGPVSGTRIIRAIFVLAVLIVVGVLVLPSATRAPRLISSVPPTTHNTTVPPPTTSTTKPVTTTTLPTILPKDIAVLVANGTGTAHGASDVRTYLGQKGFNIAALAYDTTTPETADAIYYVNSGTAAMADEVAQALSLTTSVVESSGSTPPVQTTTGADVIVVLGNDLATRANNGTLGSPPSTASTTTSTTS
ncbi:MAG: LytR C-terminal domain-containing protein [Acidimicrobiales bacterium]|jgi:LytR cell envelope-related transcriptional attenuator